jgi:hypothetical protein
MSKEDRFSEAITKIKKARLIEHNLSNEDLLISENFSDEEYNLESSKNRVKNWKNIKGLKKARRLHKQIKELNKFSIEGMKEILNTISAIDKGFRQIIFKRFVGEEVSTLNILAPKIE